MERTVEHRGTEERRYERRRSKWVSLFLLRFPVPLCFTVPSVISVTVAIAIAIAIASVSSVLSAQRRTAFDGKMEYQLTVEKQTTSAIADWWPAFVAQN